jgi:lipopolysaccharide assembly outer membrane protein LptD (OstA)
MNMKKIIYFLFSLTVIIVFQPFSVHAQLALSLKSQVHIQADTIQYIKNQNLVMARGQVHIQQGTVNLYADNIRYDTDSQDVQANGHVVWQDGSQTVEMESLTYNMRIKNGKAFNIKTTVPPWITIGSEVDIEKDKIVIKNAIATTCDYSPEYQHYHLETDKITIYSGDYLVAENVIFYIGKVPVFYFPFFVKAIHDVRTPFSFSTGSTDYLGNYLLLTNNYLFSPVNYGALYTDYFSKKGIGIGFRHEISLNAYSAFSLYGYGIEEKDTNQFRWESRLRGLWAVSSSLQGRVEADIPGDGLFSQYYSVARRDPSLVSTQRKYDVSMTLTRQNYTLGLLFDRQLLPDPNDPLEVNYIDSQIALPQINFSLFPQPFIDKNFIKYDMTVNGNHTYTQANGYYVSHLNGDFGLSESKVFLKTQTFYTRIDFMEAYQDVSDVGITQGAGSAGNTSSVNANTTWAGRWSEFYATNATYSFSKKLDNLLPTDPADGISTNLLSAYMEFTAGSLLRARTSTSYDFTVQGAPQGAKLNYLNEQFYFTPLPQFDYLAIVDYSVQANAIKDFNSVLDYKSTKDLWRFRISGNYVDPNVSNTGYINQGVSPPETPTFEIAGEVDLALFTNYRISALETYDCTNAVFESRSISLYRDLHDWEAQIGYSNDPTNGEQLFFTLNLKALPGKPISVSDQQLQNLNGIRNQGLTGSASQFQ